MFCSAITTTSVDATLAEAKADATKDDFNVTVGDEVVAVTAVTANIDNTVYMNTPGKIGQFDRIN